MKPIVVSDTLAVGEFPTPEQLSILARAGFKAVINNQPDGEVERFASAAAIEAEARRHGLAYAYAPLTSRTPSSDELDRYREAVSQLPSPIYAFCYSGARSAAGCALLLAGSIEVDRIVREFGEAGFDLEGLRPWLDEERARRAPRGEAADVRVQPAANGHGPAAANGAGPQRADVEAKPVGEVGPAIVKPEVAKGLPRMVVVQPRAAGYGGFAM